MLQPHVIPNQQCLAHYVSLLLRCVLMSLLGCLLCGLGVLRFNAVSEARELWVDQGSQQMKNLDWVEAGKWRWDVVGHCRGQIGIIWEKKLLRIILEWDGMG